MHRSTKAGARTPATHGRPCGEPARFGPRSTKAGARTPATHDREDREVAAARHVRSTKAGARTPATLGSPPPAAERARRSTKAGARTPATRVVCLALVAGEARSTKAGSRTPATRPCALDREAGEARSTKAGARTPATPPRARPPDTPAPAAQRRPGREPRRHGGRVDRVVGVADRSTKAGARTPATHTPVGSSPSLPPCAQRRPGREPRRHQNRREAVRSASLCAQRRPGREPRRHRTPPLDSPGAGRRSTKAGSRTPATREDREVASAGHVRSTKAGSRTPATLTGRGARGRAGRPALNEGRVANPGDTSSRATAANWSRAAQRRPGREPRRHAPKVFRLSITAPIRSTKAGSRTPATRSRPMTAALGVTPLNEGRGANPGDTDRSSGSDSQPASAQRRPGRDPGDTAAYSSVGGRLGSAQRRPGREPRRHGLALRLAGRGGGRSTKAGARTPATRADVRYPPRRPVSLNEGRGANPGDTPFRAASPPHGSSAQRRPGREPRRHLRRFDCRLRVTQSRSTKAGSRTPATLEARKPP